MIKKKKIRVENSEGFEMVCRHLVATRQKSSKKYCGSRLAVKTAISWPLLILFRNFINA